MHWDREQVVEKLRQDHQYMAALMRRITALCDRSKNSANCDSCDWSQRGLCHENIDQLIRVFVEVTLRHNLLESACMDAAIPAAHRAAHNRAHMEIAEQLKSIRVVFAAEGNGIVAIEGIEAVLGVLSAHLTEYDQALEIYLLTEA